MSKSRERHRKIARNRAPPITAIKPDNHLTRRQRDHKQDRPPPSAASPANTARDGGTSTAKPTRMARVSFILSALALSVLRVGGHQLNNILQQYPRSSAASQNLVNTMPPSSVSSFYSSGVAESLPLARQPYGQQSSAADLDNVIESTTTTTTTTTTNSLLLQQQPFVSSLGSRHLAGQQAACQLPPTWAGKWYQANKDPVRVTNTEISDKGICRDKKGDKYLFEYMKQAHQACLICLVINERHLNVLQYKESSCQPVPAQYLNRSASNQPVSDNDHSLLDSICSDITGDAPLESLFRLETPPIECPISGKYHFTYDNCREPQSSLDSCIDRKQLHFKFSACPDMPGSESKSEVLKCYADWSEGNNYYMIGRLEHASNHQDKGKFRCFVYEKSADGGYIQMAQSLEESCYGLINAHEGPKVLRLTARPPSINKCQFPSFIKVKSENWLSVDNSLIYMFNPNSTKYQVMETKEGNVIEEATCLQQFPLPPQVQPHQMQSQLHQARSNINQQMTVQTNRRFPPSSNQFNQIDQLYQQRPAAAFSQSSKLGDAVYLVQITKNCYTTDYCVRFYRRTSGIVQIDYFMAVPGSDDQQRCRSAYVLSTPQTQIITSTNLEEQKCPFDGAYTIEAPIETDFTYNPSNIFMCPRQSFLTAQCEQASRLRIHYKCSLAKYMTKNLRCLGSWTTNGLVRLLLADDERQRYSAWYKDYGLTNANNDELETTTSSQPQTLTRSHQLLGFSSQTSSASQHRDQPAAPTAALVDLQIAIITPMETVSKPMQVRLTRRSHCSDLRGYSSQSSLLSIPQTSSVPSYASPSASSSTQPSITNMFHATGASYGCPPFMIFSLVISLFFTMSTSRHIVATTAAQ